jgi:uncharacterized UBP type Zn finger protein
MIPAHNLAVSVPATSMNGSAPHCEHLDGLTPVTPLWDHCRDCRDSADHWVSLAVCLSCGWVACSDDSPRRHARAHYEETDHPLATSLEPGSHWRWCYVHQRLV